MKQLKEPPRSVRAVREDMVAMTERLVAEHEGLIPAGSVIRCVARCQDRLLRAGLRHSIVAATEVAARARLTAVAGSARSAVGAHA